MGKTWLVLDVSYLCWKAFHALPNFTHDGVPTAVFFGFLGELPRLQNRFQTPYVTFAFDMGPYKRSQFYKEYKQKEPPVPEVGELHNQVRWSAVELRTRVLPALGYTNTFGCLGYEADDIIASVVQTLPPGDKAVVVASDKDLWQLLEGDRVVQYDPRKGEVFGAASLFSEYGITPAQWVYVKALAGCSGDNVKGVKGVGEITAARYLKGQLTKGVKYSAIKAAENPFGILNKNLQLVRLPYPGCPQFQLKSDTVTTDKWQAVCNRLGLKTLRDKLPVVEY